jgi:hypothetical protein
MQQTGMEPTPTQNEREPEPERPERSEDGVDLTLIRWMLSLTPLERLRASRDFSNSLLRLRARRDKV